ncbi:MAG: MotA/TolQ/ExbB proton channel family protein [Candidatus Delongbacteria bacterium]|nr:MotA/TolQ/ExbB proton channel family protein [Candidatus Delongbacteria bacterium]MBN2836610.1 MotA/TolQ/ExbB proton channel family protein [Candidatus Delongbacteria bacterium]
MGRFIDIFIDQFKSQSSLAAGGENVGFFWMWIILFIGIIGISITVIKFLQIQKYSNVNPEKFMIPLLKMVERGETERALDICKKSKSNALPYVVSGGLDAMVRMKRADIRTIQDGVDINMMEIMPKLQSRISYINLIANVATLIGLAGTIFGLILAFDAVAVASDHLKTQQLSSGISAAMGTTIAGLFVAIPMNFFYTFLTNKITKLVDDIDEWAVKFINSSQKIDKQTL